MTNKQQITGILVTKCKYCKQQFPCFNNVISCFNNVFKTYRCTLNNQDCGQVPPEKCRYEVIENDNKAKEQE